MGACDPKIKLAHYVGSFLCKQHVYASISANQRCGRHSSYVHSLQGWDSDNIAGALARHVGSLARDLCASVVDDNVHCIWVIVHVDTTLGADEAQGHVVRVNLQRVQRWTVRGLMDLKVPA